MFSNELWQKPAAAGDELFTYPYQIAKSAKFDGSTSHLTKT